MRAVSLAGIAVAAILAGAGVVVARDDAVSAETKATPAGRKVLYWRHPDKADDFAPEPMRTPDGRAYLPVHDDQEADFKEVTAAKAKAERNKGRMEA